MVSFYEENSLPVFPNINGALYILNKGRSSKNLKIVAVCEKGIRYLEALCQPICPSLSGSENILSTQLSDTVIFNELSQEISENEIDLLPCNNYDNDSSTNEGVKSIDDCTAVEENNFGVVQENSVVNGSSVHIIDVQVLNSSNIEEPDHRRLEIVESPNNNLQQTGELI